MPTDRIPAAEVKIDWTDENERVIRVLIARTHAGRWPLWRSFGTRRFGGIIYEAVQWHPRRRKTQPTYSLLHWDIAALGVSWQHQPSQRAAVAALKATQQRSSSKPLSRLPRIRSASVDAAYPSLRPI